MESKSREEISAMRNDQNLIRECFTYIDSGFLVWKSRPISHFSSKRAQNAFNARYQGKEFGYDVDSRDRNKYRMGGFFNRTTRAHRLIWVFHHGPIPDGMEVDHINQVGTDNRIENLRIVDSTANHQNKPMQKNNTSGIVGVHLNRSNNKWRSIIQIKGKSVHLGYFHDIEDAISARKSAEAKYGFHENHGRIANANRPG